MVLDTVGKFKKFLEGYDDVTQVLFYDSSSEGYGAVCLIARRSSPWLNKNAPYSEERFRSLLDERLSALFADEQTRKAVVDEATNASNSFLSVEVVGKKDYQKYKVMEDKLDDAEARK